MSNPDPPVPDRPRGPFDAVVFDLGGVVFPSPLDAFRRFEREQGLPSRFLSEVVLRGGDTGAWARLERGELTLDRFADVFGAECRARGASVDARALMAAVAEGLAPRPPMTRAIRAIRGHGLATAALTNNWAPDGDGTRGTFAEEASAGRPLFDVVVESAVEGLRKPDPRIYELVCARLRVVPDRTVFLDDLGANLKPARDLGMTTIKVADVDQALAELGRVLGFPVT